MVHPATCAETALVARNAGRSSAEISLEDRWRYLHLRSTTDGNCAYCMILLFFDIENATEVKVRECT